MAITHHFHDPNNIAAGGTWKHDYGQTICSWSWDAAKKELTVTCGAKGKKFASFWLLQKLMSWWYR